MRGFESLTTIRASGTEFWQPHQQYQLALIYIDAVDRDKLTAIAFVSDLDVPIKPIATVQTHYFWVYFHTNYILTPTSIPYHLNYSCDPNDLSVFIWALVKPSSPAMPMPS
jgi:hypothetical protein